MSDDSMSEQKVGLVPRLRFPEFRDAGEWKRKTVGQLSENVIAGGTPSTSIKEYWGGSIRWMNSGELNKKKVYNVKGRITGDGLRNSSTKCIPERCVLVGLAGQGKTRGTVAMNMVELCINQSIAAIFPSDERYSSEFLYHNLDSRYEELRSLSTGAEGRGGLNLQIIRSLIIPLPGLNEQQKIANCLTSFDTLIAAQADKLDALKTHKEGLMQQLFPREGETVPRLRFPEFQEAEEWYEKPFEAFVVRSFYGTSNSTSENGQYPVLRMGNMVDGGLNFSNMVYIDLDHEIFRKIRLIRGDILMNRTNSLDLVGKISIFNRSIECITASYIVTYRLDKTQIVPEFCNYMLNTQQYQARIKALARPSISQANINPTTFRNELAISVPKIAEQERIADSLSTLDNLIAAQADKFVALQTYKKGLMQQLFPNPEAGPV